MKAVQYTDHGGPEVIEYGTDPDPVPGPEAALVDVRAGALDHLDVWTRTGLPGLDLALPHVPGSDVAGVVEAVGERVSRFAPGDRAAVTAGPTPRTGVPRVFGNRLAIPGSTVTTPGEVDDALAKVRDGTCGVRTRETLSMSETGRAHELLEDYEGFGKVVGPESDYP